MEEEGASVSGAEVEGKLVEMDGFVKELTVGLVSVSFFT